jgi:hypothetical protein
MWGRKWLQAIVSVGMVLALSVSLLPVGSTVAANSYAAGPGEIAGVSQTGAAGVSETTVQIMRRQQVAANVPVQIHTKPHFQVDRTHLKDNPLAPAVAQWPAVTPLRSAPVSPLGPQTTAISFTGATLADTGAFPPDSMGAVGPTQFIVAVNGRFRSFNKTTGVADGVLNADPDVFWASVMTPVGGSVVLNFTSDPRIRYDRLSGRWFIIMIDVPCTNATCTTIAANRVMIAMSDTSTITAGTVWTFFYFSPESATSAFVDYPTLGIDVNALYVGGNIFSSAGSFVYTSGYVVQKSSLIGGGPIFYTAFLNLTSGAAGSGPFTPQGVDNYDPAATEGYFIGVDNAVFSLLQIRRVSNPGSASPTISGNLSLTVSTTISTATVPHLGNTGGNNGRLDSLDDRLFAAHLRDGRLWTAHNFRVNASGVASTATQPRVAVRWYEIQNLTTTPTVRQSGTIFDNAATAAAAFYRWIPSIMVSGQGHAAVGFSQAGTPSYANGATVGRLAGDILGTMQTVVTYTNTSYAYNPPSDPGGASGRRWGDYSYTSLDPCDDMTMWTIQEFTDATNSYGVRAVKLNAPPPATPSSASPSSVLWGTSSVTITITGSAGSGLGFYDTPSSLTDACRLRLTASVSGGVTVNSVTYIDPTHMQINISTVGASTGLQSVTITNPDGQSIVGSNMIRIVANHNYADPAVACGGNAPCFSSVPAALNALADGGVVTTYGTHNIAASLISDNAGANSVTFDGTGTLNWTGGAGSLFTIGDGAVTVKGLNLTNATTVFNQTGAGALTAYANNILTFTTAYAGSGTPAIGHNFWGTNDPLASAPTGMPAGQWSQRMGAQRSSWAEGTNAASLPVSNGMASLTGRVGTAVIVSHGRGAANAPFGNGSAPYVNQTCSDFFDLFTINGSGTYTASLPLDATATCISNTLDLRRIFSIVNIANCSPSTNTACWAIFSAARVNIVAPNLQITELTVAELGGTPLVAGDVNGGDPTAIQLRSISSGTSTPTPWLMLGSVLAAGGAVVVITRKRRRA